MKCFKSSCYESWNIPEIFASEKIDIKNLKYLREKNIDLVKSMSLCSIPKIPHITHHIWFTSPQSPREIKERDLMFFIENSMLLNAESNDWKHILWCNSKKLIPKSIAILEDYNIQILELDDLYNGDFPLKSILLNVIDNREFGKASDIFRYIVTQQLGGVYFDMDYKLYHPLGKLTCTFDSFFGLDDFGERYFGNAFIAAKPHHPILETAVALIDRNLGSGHIDIKEAQFKILFNGAELTQFIGDAESELALVSDPNIPDYIKYPCKKFAATITQTGPTVLTVAYYLSAHQNGNIDIGFGHGVVFKLSASIPEDFEDTKGSIKYYIDFPNDLVGYNNDINDYKIFQFGNDSYSGSWINEEYMKQIVYLGQNEISPMNEATHCLIEQKIIDYEEDSILNAEEYTDIEVGEVLVCGVFEVY